MCIPSYLLLFFVLTAPAAYGYTVVLNTGKKIQGTFVTEQQNTIVIKDSQGVLISFKKTILDLQAMSLANQKLSGGRTSLPAGVQEQALKKKSLPSIVDLAAETRRKRTGKAKTMSLEDLDQTAEVSIIGSGEPLASDKPGRTESPDEKKWETRIWAMKKEVNRLREKVMSAESSCEEAREKQYAARITPSQKPGALLSTYKETSQCRKSAELATQLQEAESRLENAREEARRAGVSWQTLE
jgi:hypothetical protein